MGAGSAGRERRVQIPADTDRLGDVSAVGQRERRDLSHHVPRYMRWRFLFGFGEVDAGRWELGLETAFSEEEMNAAWVWGRRGSRVEEVGG